MKKIRPISPVSAKPGKSPGKIPGIAASQPGKIKGMDPIHLMKRFFMYRNVFGDMGAGKGMAANLAKLQGGKGGLPNLPSMQQLQGGGQGIGGIQQFASGRRMGLI